MAISRAGTASGRASSYAMGLSRFGTTCAAAFAHNSHSLGIELVQYSIHSRHSPLRGLSCRGHGIRLSLMPSMPASCTTDFSDATRFLSSVHRPTPLPGHPLGPFNGRYVRIACTSPLGVTPSHPTPLFSRDCLWRRVLGHSDGK